MNPQMSCFQTKLHENMFQLRADDGERKVNMHQHTRKFLGTPNSEQRSISQQNQGTLGRNSRSSVGQPSFGTPGTEHGDSRQTTNQQRRRSGYFNVTETAIDAGGEALRQLRRLQNQSSATERSNDSPGRSPGSTDRGKRSPGSNNSSPGSDERMPDLGGS